MNESTVTAVQAKWVEKLPPLRLGGSIAALAVALAMVFAPLAAVAYASHGTTGLLAAAIAVGVCWLGSSLALAGTWLFGRSGTSGPMFTLLFGLVFNCALPFATGLVLNRAGGPLAEAGVFGLIMTCFLFSLTVETVLSLCLLKERA
jgi:hypothetical protein